MSVQSCKRGRTCSPCLVLVKRIVNPCCQAVKALGIVGRIFLSCHIVYKISNQTILGIRLRCKRHLTGLQCLGVQPQGV